MKLLALVFYFAIFAAGRAEAQWTVTAREEQPTASPAIKFTRVTVGRDRELEVNVVAFDAKRCRIKVVDLDGHRLDEAMAGVGALAGVNGGYFHPDRTPLGLLIADGKKVHGFEKAKLLSGLVVVTGAKISVLRAAEYRPTLKVDQARQAGPFLVDGGKAVAGLNAERRARRTAFVTNGVDRFALVSTDSMTLAEAGEILALPGLAGDWKITRALNFDGGSSTGLWVKSGAEAEYQSEFNRVRDFLAIVPAP